MQASSALTEHKSSSQRQQQGWLPCTQLTTHLLRVHASSQGRYQERLPHVANGAERPQRVPHASASHSMRCRTHAVIITTGAGQLASNGAQHGASSDANHVPKWQHPVARQQAPTSLRQSTTQHNVHSYTRQRLRQAA